MKPLIYPVSLEIRKETFSESFLHLFTHAQYFTKNLDLLISAHIEEFSIIRKIITWNRFLVVYCQLWLDIISSMLYLQRTRWMTNDATCNNAVSAFCYYKLKNSFSRSYLLVNCASTLLKIQVWNRLCHNGNRLLYTESSVSWNHSWEGKSSELKCKKSRKQVCHTSRCHSAV